MATYSADQIVGKDLFAKVVVQTRSLPNFNAGVVKTISVGQRVGTVYSFITDKATGVIWWQFADGSYAAHNSAWYNVKALVEQGAKTEAQLIKEAEDKAKEENASWYDDIKGLFTTANLLKVGGVVVAIVVIKSILSK